jgi:cytoskeletal protein RodZ
MSDHEFEKQVQEKLGGLKLRPSDTVWMEVEKNIRRDKRRRRFFWLWTPMLFICLSTSAYIIYRFAYLPNQQPAIAQSTTSTTNHQQPAGEQQLTVAPAAPAGNQTVNASTAPAAPAAAGTPATGHALAQPVTSAVTPAATETTVATAETTAAATSSHTSKQAMPAAHGNGTEAGNNNDNNNIAGVGENNTPVIGWYKKSRLSPPVYGARKPLKNTATLFSGYARRSSSIAQSLQPYNETGDNKLTAAYRPFTIKDQYLNIATDRIITDSLQQKLQHLAAYDSLTQATAILPIQRKRPVLWHWGVETDAGLSRIAESKFFQLKGLLGTDKYQAEDLSQRSYSTTAGSSSFISNAGVTVKPASPIQPDLSFSAGLFVEHTFSKRFKMSLGLRYQYMSAYTTVGPKVTDSNGVIVNFSTSKSKLVKEYYKSAGSTDPLAIGGLQMNYNSSQAPGIYNKYRYRFHYIEVPVLAHWQINNARRLPPLVLDGGFSVARLMSVDALHYEGAKGIYYSDNDLFNSTQANLIMGVSVGLMQRSKHPMWIGADLRYALTGLVKREVSSGQYLWSAGISVKILLGKL